MTNKAIFLAIMINLIWGLNTIFIKLAAMEVPPVAFTFLRFFLTALIFLPFLRLKKIQREHWKPLILYGILLYSIHQPLNYIALAQMDASSFAVVLQSQVIIAVILGWLFLNEKINIFMVIGVILSFAGLITIFGSPQMDGQETGLALTLISALACALSIKEMKYMKGIDPMNFIVIPVLISLPFLGGTSLIMETNQIEEFKNANWLLLSGILVYQVILCMYSIVIWQKLMEDNAISHVSIFMLLMPLFGIIGGVIIFDETLTISMIIGSSLILLGVAIVNIKKQKI